MKKIIMSTLAVVILLMTTPAFAATAPEIKDVTESGMTYGVEHDIAVPDPFSEPAATVLAPTAAEIAEAVSFCEGHNIMSAERLNEPTTREEVWQVIYNLLGKPKSGKDGYLVVGPNFYDLPSNRWSYEAAQFCFWNKHVWEPEFLGNTAKLSPKSTLTIKETVFWLNNFLLMPDDQTTGIANSITLRADLARLAYTYAQSATAVSYDVIRWAPSTKTVIKTEPGTSFGTVLGPKDNGETILVVKNPKATELPEHSTGN